MLTWILTGMTASALALPRPDPDDIFRATDGVPVARSNPSWTTEALLFVDQTGDVFECATQHSQGSERALRQLCHQLRRMDVRPASDREGRPIHGVVGVRVTRFPTEDSDANLLTEHPDMMLPLPGNQLVGMAHALVEVEMDGRITHCEIQFAPENADDASKEAICDYLLTVPIGPMTDADGNAVRYVRKIMVSVNG